MFFHCIIKLYEDTGEKPPKRMNALLPYFDLAQSFLVTQVYKTTPRKWQKKPAVHMDVHLGIPTAVNNWTAQVQVTQRI